MSEHGLFLGGLLRSQQGLIEGAIGLVVFVTIIFFIIRSLNKSGVFDTDEADVDRIVLRTYLVTLFIIAAITVWQLLGVASHNRMPRSDVDKSGVYDQMASHGNSN